MGFPSGIRARTAVCSVAEVVDVILPLQWTVVSSGALTVSRFNSGRGIGFAAIAGLLGGSSIEHSTTRSAERNYDTTAGRKVKPDVMQVVGQYLFHRAGN